MSQRMRIFFNRAGAIAAVVAVAVLGNLRLQASEVPRAHRPATGVAAAQPAAQRGLDAALASGFDSDADGVVAEQDTAANDDDGRLVPAIYAWDPDVRFVYYRHVSKWM